MAGPVIAVTDSVFPSLDPAKAALARLNPTYRMSKSVNADDIVAVAKDADAVLVTYAKLTRDVLMQLTRCRPSAVSGWVSTTSICRPPRRRASPSTTSRTTASGKYQTTPWLFCWH